MVARSSTEAYRALAYTTTELLWLRQLLRELARPISSPPLLLCDNLGATFMIGNPIVSNRSKHIHLDYFFVREQVDSGDLLVRHVPAEEQHADIFTKQLGTAHFCHL